MWRFPLASLRNPPGLATHHRSPPRRLVIRATPYNYNIQPDADAWGAPQQQQQQQQPPAAMLCGLPQVDWTRYHLQVLFIDSSDQMRARLAAGLFEKVAEWNGYGRALYPWTCGIAVDNSPAAQLSAMSGRAALMAQASYLGLPPKLFARTPEQFELPDLDRYDVVVALDSDVRASILAGVDQQYLQYYSDKLRLLSDYAQHNPLADAEVLRRGGLALLPRRMSLQLQSDLQALRTVVDVPRLVLSDTSQDAVDRWNWMILTIMLGSAGLVRYLIDAYPPDLPEYDPL